MGREREIDRYCRLYGCGAAGPAGQWMRWCVLCGRRSYPVDEGNIASLVRGVFEALAKLVTPSPPAPPFE